MKLNIENRKYEFVLRSLHERWDPIGIYSEDAPYDEYARYASGVIKLLELGSQVNEIYDYLFSVETLSIGLKGDPKRTLEFAEWIKDSYSDEFK
ncbi:hypothetical protein [Rubinisphaera sp.]|uniref:hypothetical protein n=1 Tax=Rubinisphaera sp. TaxID=2024857 RepID=UPI000C0F0CA9|nr:hypothetical protein [Rubinisphaera sp.]MBV10298.1 hypothetical protein [Rubinisphaera sp.]HCS50479.1 hypothetical protein [Planctomycetaceae bacterium]|tara:strand:- start:1072 stop:1353 length:282 start_codon:yes stop_codon:yes gene_type:complete